MCGNSAFPHDLKLMGDAFEQHCVIPIGFDEFMVQKRVARLGCCLCTNRHLNEPIDTDPWDPVVHFEILIYSRCFCYQVGTLLPAVVRAAYHRTESAPSKGGDDLDYASRESLVCLADLNNVRHVRVTADKIIVRVERELRYPRCLQLG